MQKVIDNSATAINPPSPLVLFPIPKAVPGKKHSLKSPSKPNIANTNPQIGMVASMKQVIFCFIFIYFKKKQSLHNPLEVFLAGTYLEMIFGYSQIHFCVAEQRECSLCPNSVGCYVFEMEFLLIDCCRSQKS